MARIRILLCFLGILKPEHIIGHFLRPFRIDFCVIGRYFGEV
jgi:hypothetical protein